MFTPHSPVITTFPRFIFPKHILFSAVFAICGLVSTHFVNASGQDYCPSATGDPHATCAGDLACYSCTVPVKNINQSLQTTFSQCINSPNVGGHLAKCYKTDSRACAIVKIYYSGTDVKAKTYYFRGCVGDEDDHYKQLCIDSNQVLLKRFCYNTLRNVYATNKPVGTDDDDMQQWSCSSICCSCNGCNKNFVTLEGATDICQKTASNKTVTNLQSWYRSSMDHSQKEAGLGATGSATRQRPLEGFLFGASPFYYAVCFYIKSL